MTKTNFYSDVTLLIRDYVVIIRRINNDTYGTPRYEVTLVFTHWLNLFGKGSSHTCVMKGYFKDNVAIAESAIDAWAQYSGDNNLD